jgi:penicillin-binding protein 2
MKFFLPQTRFANACLTLVFAALLLSTGLQAQTKKKSSTSTKKAVAKKTAAPAKDARKDNKKQQLAKSRKDQKKEKASARDSKKEREQARRDSKKEKATAKNDRDAKKSKKQTAKERRAEEARRRAEEARRQAAIEAQRRREEAARIARERKLAFERGLRNQTAENIAKDSTEGEDLEIRQAAVEALGSRAGTVVVMEAKTGKIVTMVNQEWAIKNSFKPCSTIKLVTGVGGLNEGVINQEGGIGESTAGLDLDRAVARSNNPYFQRVGSNFGNAKMIAYAKTLGLGEKTGINAEGETPGKLPFGNKNARIYSHGDDFEVTPLQLAVMVTAIANGGQKVVPQIVKQQQNVRASARPKFREPVSVPYRTVQGVIPGMIGAAEWGTAARGVDHSQGIAGKTGSCIFKGSWIGLFASVAPVEDPQYAVAVITRGEGERGKYAAAVAGKLYRALAPRMRRNQERYLALKNLRPNPAQPDNMAEVDEDEEDDDAVASGDTQEERPVIVVGTNNTTPKKLVQKTTQSRPTSAPVTPLLTPQVNKPVATTQNKPLPRMENKPAKLGPVIIEYDKEKAARGEPTRPRIVKN